MRWLLACLCLAQPVRSLTLPSPALPHSLPAALETAHTSLQQRLNETVLELDSARVSKTQADADYDVARSELQQRAAEAERRSKVLAEQRDVLQQQLEKAAAEAPGEGELSRLCARLGGLLLMPATSTWQYGCCPALTQLSLRPYPAKLLPVALSEPLPCLLPSLPPFSPVAGGDFSEALRLLRQEREAAEINLQLAEREVGRLRQEASVAKRAAEEARAQLGAEVERARSAVRDEQDQAALMAKLEQFNLLRESNATLRWVAQSRLGWAQLCG